MGNRRVKDTRNAAEAVNNPVFREVEEAGLAHLRRTYGDGSVVDNRHRNTFYDAEVYAGTERLSKLDFKADQFFVTTGNVVWEDVIEAADGTVKDGWGRKELDLCST